MSPREAAAKLKGLFPGARSKSERAELLEREAAAAAGGGGASGSGSQSARGAGGGGYWAAAGKIAPYNRSASEIKRAYGHGASSSSSSRCGAAWHDGVGCRRQLDRPHALEGIQREEGLPAIGPLLSACLASTHLFTLNLHLPCVPADPAHPPVAAAWSQYSTQAGLCLVVSPGS